MRRLLPALALAALSATPACGQDAAGFDQWLRGFRAEAAQQGIESGTLERAFAGIRYNAKVIELDRHQPEFVKPIGEYIAAQVTPDAVARGREKQRLHASVLARVQQRYGVQPEYVVAIWRLETFYGANFGSFNVVEALATLAYAGQRGGFWNGELLAALRLQQRGEVPPPRMIGSWAGAMGHTQFMPSVYLARAVDFDGDGRRDLWNSLPDVFASTANYLALAGWQAGLPFGVEVRLPSGFPFELADTAQKPVGEWKQLGVTRRDGAPLPDWPGNAGVVVPAGHRGPAFLVSANYRALLAYNNAPSYALSVGLLAESMRDGRRALPHWPAERPLSRGDKEEVQRLLAERGHEPGPIDGQLGSQTRAALRAFQKKAGLPADGHADHGVLEGLRRSTR